MARREPVDIWYRNPHNYVAEMVDAGVSKIAWDRGVLVNRGIEPHMFGRLHFPDGQWRAMCIGVQGAAEVDSDHTLDAPKAVYPVWSYTQDLGVLEDLLENPIGEDPECYNDMNLSPDERPVQGQEHRVVIVDLPDTRYSASMSFMRQLKELQEDYPDAYVHLHALYSFRWIFGMGFKGADFEPRTDAAQGRVFLPNGKKISVQQTTEYPQWIRLFGFSPGDLTVPRNRCIYNMKSAEWAAQYYDWNMRFKAQGTDPVDIMSSDAQYQPVQTTSHTSNTSQKAQPGDKLVCNSCSLQKTCKIYREGSVCTLPGSVPNSLSKQFGSRDVETIIDGLSNLMQTNAKRLERGLRDEEIGDEIDKKVTQLTGQIFDQGGKLLKILDPKRFGPQGAKVEVSVGGTQVNLNGGNERALVAQVIRELESQGIPIEQIENEMTMGYLRGMADPQLRQQAIEGEVLKVERTD